MNNGNEENNERRKFRKSYNNKLLTIRKIMLQIFIFDRPQGIRCFNNN